MGTATFYLILVIFTGRGVAIEQVPMGSAELCQTAAAQAKALEGGFSTYKTLCVRATQ